MSLLWTMRVTAVLSAALCAPVAQGAGRAPESFTLPNGMTFVLVRRPEISTIAAGWVVRAGSAAETPGETGLAHYLEHAMFHGSRTVGTRDAEAEKPMLAEEDRLRAALAQRDDAVLARRLTEVSAAQQRLAVRNAFDAEYARGGASGLNAITTEDFTAFFVRVPADRLELWFWMESDRLLTPVFRGFYEEREVIRAERRQRLTDDNAILPRERSLAALWDGHPYGWAAMGLEDDLEALTRPLALRFFERYYRPVNLTAVLVGPVDRPQVEAFARRYFGRLAPCSVEDCPPVREPRQPAPGERRLATSWAGAPVVHLEYRTIPGDAADAVGLDLLAGVIESRFGAFWQSLVAAGPLRTLRAAHEVKRWGGCFTIDLEARDTVSFNAVEALWQRELERIAAGGPAPGELRRVRNQLTTDAYRRLEDPYLLLVNLLVAAGRGNWRGPLSWAEQAKAVTPSDVGRLAAIHLVANRRVIARWLPAGEP